MWDLRNNHLFGFFTSLSWGFLVCMQSKPSSCPSVFYQFNSQAPITKHKSLEERLFLLFTFSTILRHVENAMIYVGKKVGKPKTSLIHDSLSFHILTCILNLLFEKNNSSFSISSTHNGTIMDQKRVICYLENKQKTKGRPNNSDSSRR